MKLNLNNWIKLVILGLALNFLYKLMPCVGQQMITINVTTPIRESVKLSDVPFHINCKEGAISFSLTKITGFTNQLMYIAQSMVIANLHKTPLNFVGFLEVGCEGVWMMCDNNVIHKVDTVFKIESFKVDKTRLENNKIEYCGEMTVPGLMSEVIPDITKLIAPYNLSTKLNIGMNTFNLNKFAGQSWREFVERLQYSPRVHSICSMIISSIGQELACVHDRKDSDWIHNMDPLNDAVKKYNNIYLIRRSKPNTTAPQVRTKWDFSDDWNEVLGFGVDLCVCQTSRVFLGILVSTFSNLIAVKRGFGKINILYSNDGNFHNNDFSVNYLRGQTAYEIKIV